MRIDRLRCEYCKGWGIVGGSVSLAITIRTLRMIGWTMNMFGDFVCPECREAIVGRDQPLLRRMRRPVD